MGVMLLLLLTALATWHATQPAGAMRTLGPGMSSCAAPASVSECPAAASAAAAAAEAAAALAAAAAAAAWHGVQSLSGATIGAVAPPPPHSANAEYSLARQHLTRNAEAAAGLCRCL